MGRNAKKLVLAGGLIGAFIIGILLFKVAENFVLHSYSSGKIVLENVPDEEPLPINENKVVGDNEKVSDIPDMVYPSQVYDEEGVIMRCKEYLGDDYYDYEDLFKSVVGMGDEPFSNLSKDELYMITMEMNNKGLIVANGFTGNEENLDDYTYCDIGDFQGGAEAVYLYDDTKVIYRLNTKETTFLVVDYSNSVIDISTDLVEFGKVFNSSLYFVPELCNKQQIEGYTVYFSYNVIVTKEW